ncbi:MAG: type I-MYXAN CRISPR-associated protein Cmx8 [Chloroflexota bacterium]|nr:MAG: type I-MYXAN CRISPR-associated protein Cmx8 [Chloroflexota bacterium]
MDELRLSYNLFDLPTAQHRAGLAGLLIHLRTLQQRGYTDVPEVATDGSGGAALTLTKTALRLVLNDLYHSSLQEISRPTRLKGSAGKPAPEPLRTESVAKVDRRTGKESLKTVYVYPQVVPGAPFLEGMDMPEPWLKLWREVVWSILRGIPKTRVPYEQRAEGADVTEATALWNDLERWGKAVKNGRLFTTEVSGAMFLGAQALNAERVPFRGSPEQNLLLHFWPVVMGVGEARKIALDHGKVEEKPVGYVVTVPDVSDLEGFAADFTESVAQLDKTMVGYRPAAAVLSLPEEGALRYLADLASMARGRSMAGPTRFSVTNVEVYQLMKRGNSILTLSAQRIPAKPQLLDLYKQIGRRYYDLEFRGHLIRNVLRDQPWYDGFHRLFATGGWARYVGPMAGRFAGDAGRKFSTEFEAAREQEVEMEGDAKTIPQELTRRVHSMVRQYVEGRTESKSGIKWADFKDKRMVDPNTGKDRLAVPDKYREAREKVCQDAFLAVRACRSRQDFVTYFTGNICAVPQYIPTDDYQALAGALLGNEDEWERIKALSMLALSALSRL